MPRRDRQVSADDRVRAHHTVLDAGQVHRAALSAQQSALTPHELAQDGRERHTANRSVMVAAIRTERVVVGAHGGAESRRNRFLPGGQVACALDEVLQEEIVRTLLEIAAVEHEPIDLQARLLVDLESGIAVPGTG